MAETNNTSPIVELADDPAHTNRILIAVSCSIVGLAFILAIAFFYIRRNNCSSSPHIPGTIFPPIQPDIVQTVNEFSPDHCPDSSNSARTAPVKHPHKPIEQRFVDQNRETPIIQSNARSFDDVLRIQAMRRLVFKMRQSSFREQRDERRNIASKTRYKFQNTEGPKNVSTESFETPEPTLLQEQEILSEMTRSRSKSVSVKTAIFKDMVLRWHPDKRLSDTTIATSVFQFIQARKNWFLDSSPCYHNFTCLYCTIIYQLESLLHLS